MRYLMCLLYLLLSNDSHIQQTPRGESCSCSQIKAEVSERKTHAEFILLYPSALSISLNYMPSPTHDLMPVSRVMGFYQYTKSISRQSQGTQTAAALQKVTLSQRKPQFLRLNLKGSMICHVFYH